MSATILVNMYCIRHGQPTEDESDLSDLGRAQVAASHSAHLSHMSYRYVLMVGSSEMGRAKAALDVVCDRLGNPTRIPNAEEQNLGYNWLIRAPSVPKWSMPKLKSRNVHDLLAVWPPALMLGYNAWECLQRTIRSAVHTRDSLGRPNSEYDVIIAGHSGVLESMAWVPPRDSIHLTEVPILGHADILRYTVRYEICGGVISNPMILTIMHFPCPIKTPPT